MKIKHVVFVMCMCLVFAVVGCGKKGAEPVAVDEKMISVMFVIWQ